MTRCPCATGAWVVVLAAAAYAVTVPGSSGRLDVSGYIDGLAVIGTEGGAEQRPQALGLFRIDGRLTPRLRAHLEFKSRVGGPLQGAHAGIYDFQHTFQNHSPSAELAEAHLALRFDHAEVRAGVQRVAWGRLDGTPPTDVVNPRDLHDPIVVDAEEAKVGIPALQGTYFLPDIERWGLAEMRATLIYTPLAVPSRLPLVRERWFPSNAVPGDTIVLGRHDAELLLERTLASQCRRDPSFAAAHPEVCAIQGDVFVSRDVTIPTTLDTLNHRPPHRFDRGGLGVRFGGTWRAADWTLYHYSGPETGPNVALESTVVLTKNLPADSRIVTLDGVRARNVLRQTDSTIHLTGFDAAAALGGATMRAEAAYVQDRPYLRVASDLIRPAALRQLRFRNGFVDRALTAGTCTPKHPCRTRIDLGDLFPESDAIEWGIGADYLWHGLFTLVQLNQIVLLDSMPQLVVGDPDTRFTALLRRRFWSERVEVELRAVYGIEPQAWLVFPRVSWTVTDDLRVRVGYLAIGGDPHSLIGQYGANDEVVLQARYSF